jgi:cystathionine beta-lyase
VHAGSILDVINEGVNSPIFPSTAHGYLDREMNPYPRYFNTANQQGVVEKLCVLEQAEAGVVFASGMAAISSVLLSFLSAGDHVVLQEEIYGGSQAFIEGHLERFGISYSFTVTEADAIEAAIRPETRVIYIETPTNPLLSIIDIRRIAEMGRRHGTLTVIDNTFATPINQNPIPLGIDIVVHSGTKYLGGHSDLSCGFALTRRELADKIRATATGFGGNLNAQTCYLLERSLKTLALRVERQTLNATQLAAFLSTHPGVSRVFYPGLVNHPGHHVAVSQMSGFGAMLAFEIDAGLMSAYDFMKRLKLIKPALSLGGVETTVCDPVSTSHAGLSVEERLRLGITDSVLRLSAGIENCEDLIEDIGQALGS